MRRHSCWLQFVVLLIAVAALPARLSAQDGLPRKVAFLVGINKYQKPAFSNLAYAESDVTEVAAELRKQGFQVTTLFGSGTGAASATRENITNTVNKLVAPLGKSDMMLVMLSGHGQQFEVRSPDGTKKEDAFYCPVDAVSNNPETLFSISYLIDEVLAPNVGRKLVLIDACRDQPKDPGRGARGVQGRVIALPEDTAVLFSCRAGQQSYELDNLKHGLFTHCVLDGLRGGAAQDAEVSWSGLVAHVSRRMSQDDLKKLLPPGTAQTPIPAGGVEYTVLARVTATKPIPSYASWEPRIINAARMPLRLIKPGEFIMGGETSPEELGRVNNEKVEYFYDEQPRHLVKITKPFYIGEFEVTQSQYVKVMGTNPSWFSSTGGGKDQVSGIETGNWPVEMVLWHEAVQFCQELSRLEAASGRTYRLPTDAEWEYACRAGTTTAYHFGNSCIGTEANVLGSLQRTCIVGLYAANPWGLHDMHGNVLEWVQDWHDPGYYAVSPAEDPPGPATPSSKRQRGHRGGGWLSKPGMCRSADRWEGGDANTRYHSVGFRVVMVPQ